MNVEFYVLEQPGYQQALLFACQLIEKAYQNHQQVYVHTSSADEANKMDNLLWVFREDSFLPHNLYEATDDFPPTIQIGYDTAPAAQRHVLLNLSKDIPAFHQQFQQIIEIVFSEPTVQQLGRERYKQYRDNGYHITTHKIKATTL